MSYPVLPQPCGSAQFEFAMSVCGFMGHDEQMRPRLTTAREVVAALDPAVPLQRAYILAVEGVCRYGARYSGHSSDVCVAAWRAVGRSEPSPFEARHVEALLSGKAVW